MKKIFNYLYKTEQGRNVLHIIIGGLITLSYSLFYKLDDYKPLYITLFVGIVGLLWETYHWKFNKAKFDVNDIFRGMFGALIILFINKII